jgi:hypothetical protein
MGDELTRRVGKYWILFYQPLPEAGERIAIALAFEGEKGRARVEYDPKFAKVLKMYPDADPDGLAFCLDSLRTDLEQADAIGAVLGAFGPQITASEARRIASPVPANIVEMLMNRYVFPATRAKRRESRADPVGKEIVAFARAAVDSNEGWLTNVNARVILGRSLSGTKRVALAIPSESGWTLVDGVDLNRLTPRATAARADDVSRTFWNYHRFSGAGLRIRRVGVVLNGNSHLAANTSEAHDYALHRFQVDSDLAIDAASIDSRELLRNLLAHRTD